MKYLGLIIALLHMITAINYYRVGKDFRLSITALFFATAIFCLVTSIRMW